MVAGRDTDGRFEIRWGRPPVRARSAGAAVSERDGLARWLLSVGQRFDVYVGGAVRARRGFGKAAVDRTWVLWADADEPVAVERLRHFAYVPSMTVRSGTPGRLQAWWALSEPLATDEAEAALRRLRLELASDPSTVNIGRVLRVPGTVNLKDGERRVEVETCAGTVYDAETLLEGLPFAHVPQRARMVSQRAWSRDSLRDIPSSEYVARLAGRDTTGRKKVHCPFHGAGQERTPSLHLYPLRWWCYGCGRGGDIYNFAAWLWLGQRNASGDSFRSLRARLLRELGGG